MKVLVDIGGSGIKMANYHDGKISSLDHYGKTIGDYDSFISTIKKRSDGSHLSGIALSLAGFIDSNNGKVISCKNAPFLEGDLVKRLHEDFKFSKIKIVNDGEAHTRALLYPGRHIELGAIHFAFGTSVAFGVIDKDGHFIKTCCGDNWDIGDLQMITRETESKEVWYILGEKGLSNLEKKSKDPYYHFGCRIGTLLTNMAVIFRPRTIGVSGGIVCNHKESVVRGIKDCYKDPVMSKPVKIEVLSSPLTVMEGLSTLL